MHRSIKDMHAPKLAGPQDLWGKTWKDIIKMWLVLNNDNYGTQYLSSLPYHGGSFIIDKNSHSVRLTDLL